MYDGAARGPEPSLADIFQGFDGLVESTHCPYAPRARTRFVPVAYALGSAPFLDAFRSNEHWLSEPDTDAVVIAIRDDELCSGLAEQAKTFRVVLELISGVRSCLALEGC